MLLTFRESISSQIGRVNKIVVPGGSIELEQTITRELQVSADEANALPLGEGGQVTVGDISRARTIQRIATEDDLPDIRSRMLDIASEYQRVRGSMPSGNERTRAMTVIVGQMRALGQAAFPLRGELAFSGDPGQRLAAIAIAQIRPDIYMAGWIASRVGPSERPFLQYHALQALLIAARNANPSQVVSLEQAYRIAQDGYERLSHAERTDRRDLLDELSSEISRLQQFRNVETATQGP